MTNFHLNLVCLKGIEGDLAVEMALKEPERFVAKPQREGGGKSFNRIDLISMSFHGVPKAITESNCIFCFR